MLLGQCGIDKSGNYLLWCVLKKILEQINEWNSWGQYSNCWSGILSEEYLYFQEEAEIDTLYVHENEIVLKKSQHRIFIGTNTNDVNIFNKKSKLIWTHQMPRETHFTVLHPQRKWIYIMRDCRDVINSWIHFAVFPNVIKRTPGYQIKNAKELYELPGWFDKHVAMWKDHVSVYQDFANHYLLVRFEDLIENKQSTINKIITYLDITDYVDIDKIISETSFVSMKKQAPQHLRKGIHGNWRNYFSKQHVDIVKEICGELLIKFGYEQNYDW